MLGVSAEDLAKGQIKLPFSAERPRAFVSNCELCCVARRGRRLRGLASMPRRPAASTNRAGNQQRTNRDEFHHNRRQARLQAAWQSQRTAATANATTRESASQEALAARALSW